MLNKNKWGYELEWDPVVVPKDLRGETVMRGWGCGPVAEGDQSPQERHLCRNAEEEQREVFLEEVECDQKAWTGFGQMRV